MVLSNLIGKNTAVHKEVSSMVVSYPPRYWILILHTLPQSVFSDSYK